MLKRIIKIKLMVSISIIFGLILVQLITGYIFGFKARDELNMQFKKITDSPYIIVDHYSYKRGFFSSDVSAELSINNQALTNILKAVPSINESSVLGHKYSIKYNMHVTHGIFAGILNGNFVPTIAVTRTIIQYPDALNKVLNKFFVNRQPLYITSIIYLNKSGAITVTSPAFNYEEALSGVKIIWSGLHLVTKYNKTFDHFHNNLSIPKLSIDAPTKGKIILSGVSYVSDSHYSKNKIKVGETDLILNKISVNLANSADVGFKLGDLLSSLTGISATEFLNELDVINPANFILSNLSYHSVSQDTNGYFGANAEVKFDSLVTESSSYGPFKLDVSANHILSDKFSKMIDEVAKLSTESMASSDQGKRALVFTLKRYFAPILVESPILQINNFELTTPSGLIKISGSFTTSGFNLSDINNERDFLRKISANIDFSIPKNVLSYLFMMQTQYFLSAGNAEMDKQSELALKKVVNILLDNQLSAWKKKGYIKDVNGILSGNLRYDNGRFTHKP